MPRYIELAEVLRGKVPHCSANGVEILEGEAVPVEYIKSLPTVTLSTDDVRGVVHCKDCKWCHAGYCEKYDDLIPCGCANKPWEDWFCADGKRREAIKEAQDAD